MAGASEAASDRILLEPYKYLLQLPGESFSRSAAETAPLNSFVLMVIESINIQETIQNDQDGF